MESRGIAPFSSATRKYRASVDANDERTRLTNLVPILEYARIVPRRGVTAFIKSRASRKKARRSRPPEDPFA